MPENKRYGWKQKALSLFLILTFIFTLYQGDMNVEAATTTKLHFINVTNSEYNKGDASLIEYNNKYMLIDGGRKYGFKQLDSYLKKHCKKTNGKIVLDTVVLSHNHSDHYDGIIKIIESPQYQVKSIYYPKMGNRPEYLLDAIRKVPKRKVVAVGSVIPFEDWNNGPDIYIYGPAKDFTDGNKNTAEDNVNNSSMIVRVNSLRLNAIFLGDLKYTGLKAFKDRYDAALAKSPSKRSANDKLYLKLFQNKYDVCKAGHHGIRFGKGYTTAEMKIYNDVINADYNILTARLNPKTTSTFHAFITQMKNPCFDLYTYRNYTSFTYNKYGFVKNK